MQYRYKVYTTEKKITEGTLKAGSEALAEEALYHAGHTRVLSLEEQKARLPIEELLPTLFGVRPPEVVEFTGQLATLLTSGISLLASLKLLRGQIRKKALSTIVEKIIEAIQGGISLSSAMSAFPQAFPDTFCQLIRAGEQAGEMETGLRQAAGFLERQIESSRKVKKAARYPVMIIIVALAVVILMVTVALPPMINLFTSLDTELPWTTNLLLSVASGITEHGLVILIVILVLFGAVSALLRLEKVIFWKDGVILQLPIFGILAIERSMERFTRTTSMLVKAGLRLPVILDIVIRAETNKVLREAFVAVKERLLQGEGLSRPVGDNHLFPSLLVEMITVGESTGTMDTSLETMSNFYEEKVNRRLDSVISMIEPVMTAIIGAVVIFIALSMITPLYSVMQGL